MPLFIEMDFGLRALDALVLRLSRNPPLGYVSVRFEPRHFGDIRSA